MKPTFNQPKRRAIAVLAFFCLVIAIGACKKNANTPTGSYQNIAELLTAMKSTPQNFNVEAGSAHTIVGAKGTVINFYPNSFLDIKGNPITSGTINIQLTEMTSPGEMIANGSTTMTTTQYILQSGGEVNITATMNGQSVKANRYGIGFPQSAPSTKPMQLYFGVTGSLQTSNLIGTSLVNWNTADSVRTGTSSQGTVNVDSSLAKILYYNSYYIFDSCTNFGWINCDHVFTQPTTEMTINIVLPDKSFDPTNTMFFIVIRLSTPFGTYPALIQRSLILLVHR